MAIFKTLPYLERTHAADVARVANFQKQIDALDRQANSGTFEERAIAAGKAATARTNLAVAEGLAGESLRKLQEARAEADIKEADAEHRAEEKQAEVDKRLVLEAADLSGKLAALLSKIEASRQRTEAVNEARGDRPLIPDAEFRVRNRPGKFISKIVETNRVWVDAAGNVVKGEIYDLRTARWIQNPAAVRQENREFIVRNELQLPPEMPERLADVIQLIDLQGQQIWPTEAYSSRPKRPYGAP
jgi:hypothetical protein